MCGRCCRNQWQVTLSKDSYVRNEQFFSARQQQVEFAQAFSRLAIAEQQDGDFACINKKDDGGCWFVQGDNLCELHRLAGHQHLDIVCQTFPRYPIVSARGMEVTLSLSCPAAAALVQREQPLAIVRASESPTWLPPDSHTAAVFPYQYREHQLARYYFELEQHFIDIMQARALTIDERLAFLCETITACRALAGSEELGRSLTGLFNRNYDELERRTLVGAAAVDQRMYLVEHFFVNFIFKKPFYLYSWDKVVPLMAAMWNYLQGSTDMLQAVQKLEFDYGHNRKALWR